MLGWFAALTVNWALQCVLHCFVAQAWCFQTVPSYYGRVRCVINLEMASNKFRLLESDERGVDDIDEDHIGQHDWSIETAVSHRITGIQTEGDRIYVATWENWNFARTLSYWIAILYLEGSVLFCIGGAFSLTSLVDATDELRKGLVGGPYFAGGVCFGLGAYCGVLQVLNLDLEVSKPRNRRLIWCGACRHWRQAAKTNGKSAAWAYFIYFVGALSFQLSVAGALVDDMYVHTDTHGVLHWPEMHHDFSGVVESGHRLFSF